MTNTSLIDISDRMAAIVDTVAPSVVQVLGRRRPASGIVYATDTVLTTTRALGREDGLRVTTADGRTTEAELAGWDPAIGIALLRVKGLSLTPAALSDTLPRVGQLALAIARSWSNAVTASAGIVAVIGGPLRTGRSLAIERVIRTTAPMHDGFAGGAFVDSSGKVAGVATAAAIRGLGVVIPSSIAWTSAASVLKHGRPKLGFLGLAGQPVRLTGRQRDDSTRDAGLLITAVTKGSPAETAGLFIGDTLLDFDAQAVQSPDDLLALLTGDRVGRQVPVRVLRGTDVRALDVIVGERQPS